MDKNSRQNLATTFRNFNRKIIKIYRTIYNRLFTTEKEVSNASSELKADLEGAKKPGNHRNRNLTLVSTG